MRYKFKCQYCGKGFEGKVNYRKCCSRSCSNSNRTGIKETTNYFTIHDRIKKLKPKPKLCEDCHKEKKLELANISGEYKEDIKDYKYLCRSCHTTFDNKVRYFKEYYKTAKRDRFGKFLPKGCSV